MKEEINTLVKHKGFIANYKSGEKELEKNLIEQKKENLEISNKLQNILNKINNKKELDKNDKEFLNKILKDSKKNVRLCEEIDFNLDDPHCAECEYFINCMLRYINNKKISN